MGTERTIKRSKKLAISCDMTKTMMAYEMVKIVVNHLDFINFLEKGHNQDEQYRIVPIKQNGKISYYIVAINN